MLIRITTKKGDVFYLSEGNVIYGYDSFGFTLHKSISKAKDYSHILEFKVGWKQCRNKLSLQEGDEVDVIESVDSKTLEVKEVDMGSVDVDIEQEVELSLDQFYSLLSTQNAYAKDKDDNWISFPKEEDRDRISYINIYKRSLCHVISDGRPGYHNWKRRDGGSWTSSFTPMWWTMKHPVVMQLHLMKDVDQCHALRINRPKK